jgi:2-oxoglutarate dehydrogenase E1 component
VTDPLDAIQQANAAYIDRLYARFREDPTSVPSDWAVFFAGFEFGGSRPAAPAAGATGGVIGLVDAYRESGHLIAHLDPLSEPPSEHPLLDPGAQGLNASDLDQPLGEHPFRGPVSGTFRDLVAALRDTYCGSIGVEFMGIPERERREWLEQRMEAVRNRPTLPASDRVNALQGLRVADAFEQFLHVKYVGQKRFSLEGGATLIPMLEALIDAAAAAGVEQVVIGMPHRGRLNVLANVLHKPLDVIFGEFEANFAPNEVQGHGDVKYHLGYSTLRTASHGRAIDLDLNFNPSHLEFVNPVVLGSMRARQDHMGDADRARGIPVLIHGDAAFSGEGIVPETLVLAQLPAYRTGGTIHIVVNNQVGFTTSPSEARASRYCTDVARAVHAPVFHVNGDDPEAALHAVRLAVAYRHTFKSDVFVDLVCYRKHGHNEMDDPTFTQPVMYRAIASHVPASRQYADRLLAEGVLEPATLEAIDSEIDERLQAAHRRARATPGANDVPLGGAWNGLEWAGEDWSADTSVPRDRIHSVLAGITRVPEGFHVHPRAARLLEERTAMVAQDRIDWGCGEALALGTLLMDGFHVRLSGQDSGRGTFSHRHAILHDHENGERWVALQNLSKNQGRFEIIDTMLSEAAVLGFEYGYTTADPNTLVLWEAQFGDFVNVGQVIIDQFLASAESKWRRMSGLVLLLPHGYEGQGPEHSSARLERFLELCADGNLQVCNLTTPAQLFHVLRRQQHRRFRKPLVLMSPKSLLRHKRAVSPVAEFTSGVFRNVIDDGAIRNPESVSAVLLVSGKLAYALEEAREESGREEAAIVRVEQLYPFPRLELVNVLKRYPHVREVRWVQEEPANMGGWRSLRHRIEAIVPPGVALRLVSRPASPSPATGYYPRHVEEERRVIERALAASDARISTPASRRTAGHRVSG